MDSPPPLPADDAAAEAAPLEPSQPLSQFAEARAALFGAKTPTASSRDLAAPVAEPRQSSQFKDAVASLKSGSAKSSAPAVDRDLTEAEKLAVAEKRLQWAEKTGKPPAPPSAKIDRDLTEEEKKRVATLR